jgi:hypothetical protein
MSRFAICSGSLIAEVCALSTAPSPAILTLSLLGMAGSVAVWLPVYKAFVDRLVGLDL